MASKAFVNGFIIYLFFCFSERTFCLREIKPVSYITTDGIVVSEVAFIIEFEVLSDEKKNVPLYAGVDGKALTIVKSVDGTKYQISWMDEVSRLVSHTYIVKIYDEHQFVALIKSQLKGNKKSDVPATFYVPLYLGFLIQESWVQSEFLAVVCAIFLCYIAFSMKSKLMNNAL